MFRLKLCWLDCFARLRKPFDVWRGHFDALVLGTSQVEQSFDPEYLAPHGVRLYNLGLSELRLYEMAMLLDHAARTGDMKLALISVDFVRYGTPPWGPSFLPRDWNRARLVAQYAKSLTAFRTLLDSVGPIALDAVVDPAIADLQCRRRNRGAQGPRVERCGGASAEQRHDGEDWEEAAVREAYATQQTSERAAADAVLTMVRELGNRR